MEHGVQEDLRAGRVQRGQVQGAGLDGGSSEGLPIKVEKKQNAALIAQKRRDDVVDVAAIIDKAESLKSFLDLWPVAVKGEDMDVCARFRSAFDSLTDFRRSCRRPSPWSMLTSLTTAAAPSSPW